ncbi:MAG: Fe-S cluster assembly sulfur transfer protein SufU, partial [Microgenomates group bacterium]
MSLYQEIILEHYRHPKNYGQIKNPSKKIKITNPLCGDEIEMMIKLKGDKIGEIKFQGQGCAISQAAASMLTEYCLGKTK